MYERKAPFTTEADAIHAAGEDSGDHSPGQGAKRRSPESSPVVWIQTDSNLKYSSINYLTLKAKTQ